MAALLVRHHRPSGGRRAEVKVEQSSIWLLSLTGSGRRQLTPWRSAYNEVPESFEPDGSALGVIRCVRIGAPPNHRCRTDAIALPLDGGGETRIAKDATGLAFSPDGSRVALLRPGQAGDDLWVAAADGSDLRLISDGPDSEKSPSWDPSSQRLAFVMATARHYPQGFTVPGNNSLLQINADGTCQTELQSESTSFSIRLPSWQPDPGRGAGPISC
jgi:hypothetical protein